MESMILIKIIISFFDNIDLLFKSFIDNYYYNIIIIILLYKNKN